MMGEIIYRINILKALKKKGYTTTRLQKERILSESAIQSLREGKVLSIKNITKLCYLLERDVGDILVYVDDHDHDDHDIEEFPVLRYRQDEDGRL